MLGLVVADMLFERFPTRTEGELRSRLNALVTPRPAPRLREEIGAARYRRQRVRRPAARKRAILRADVCEALIAALYLDGGLDAARASSCAIGGRGRARWAGRSATPRPSCRNGRIGAAAAVPAYTIDGREGPDHAPLFEVEVQRRPASSRRRGSGRSKREAEQEAARRSFSAKASGKEQPHERTAEPASRRPAPASSP